MCYFHKCCPPLHSRAVVARLHVVASDTCANQTNVKRMKSKEENLRSHTRGAAALVAGNSCLQVLKWCLLDSLSLLWLCFHVYWLYSQMDFVHGEETWPPAAPSYSVPLASVLTQKVFLLNSFNQKPREELLLAHLGIGLWCSGLQ